MPPAPIFVASREMSPSDTESVTFDVDAPANAAEVRLYIEGREAETWPQGGDLSFTVGSFTDSCSVNDSATALLPDGRLVVPTDPIPPLEIVDTTAPTITKHLDVVVLEAQACESGVGWADYVPWRNVHLDDACSAELTLTPGAGAESRFYLDAPAVTVGLIAEDASHNVSEATTFDVKVVNTPPSLLDTAPGAADEGSLVTLVASASDVRSSTLTFRWSWGDGTPTEQRTYSGLSVPSSASDSASHTYGDNGTYTVTFSVEDDCGSVVTKTTTVTVSNVAPEVEAPAGIVLTQGYPALVMASATDPGSDDLTFEWEWNVASLPVLTGTHFNNGASPDPPMSGPGVAPFEAADAQTVSHDVAGDFEITVTVTDDDGGSSDVTVPVRITKLFADATDGSGVDVLGAGGGVVWCDLNADGALDLLLNGAGGTRLLHNAGDGTYFRDVTETHAPELEDRGAHRSVVCGDLNGDGYLDFARTAASGVEMFVNRGPDTDWSFDAPVQLGPPDDDTGLEGFGLLDFDLDGDLDAVVGSETAGVKLRENKSGDFDNAGHKGLPREERGDFLAVADHDGDGFTDILTRQTRDANMWNRSGPGNFKPNSSFTERATGDANRGAVAFCDFQGDGDLDVIWTDGGVTQIWRNDAGTFVPTGEPGNSSGFDLTQVNVDGAACGDADNDGDIDLMLSGVGGPGYLFINHTLGPDQPLAFLLYDSGIDLDANAPSVAFGDADRDGDLDLAVSVEGGVNQLWRNQRNEATRSDYLAVRALRCIGEGQYRDDIGAIVRLFAVDGVTPAGPAQEVNGAAGHGSQSPALVHFGLPNGPELSYVVEVRFLGRYEPRDGHIPGPVVRESIVPSDLGGYQLLEVTSCSASP